MIGAHTPSLAVEPRAFEIFHDGPSATELEVRRTPGTGVGGYLECEERIGESRHRLVLPDPVLEGVRRDGTLDEEGH